VDARVRDPRPRHFQGVQYLPDDLARFRPLRALSPHHSGSPRGGTSGQQAQQARLTLPGIAGDLQHRALTGTPTARTTPERYSVSMRLPASTASFSRPGVSTSTRSFSSLRRQRDYQVVGRASRIAFMPAVDRMRDVSQQATVIGAVRPDVRGR
jgi:hypothetical protein